MSNAELANGREDKSGYFRIFPDTTESARIILPLLFGMIGTPRSMVDLGGGVGTWAKVAKELGVSRVTCVDDPSNRFADLVIDKDEFVGCDLGDGMPEPIKSDLAISLEVAEHLPQCMGPALVRFLTSSAPIVLFSAAIPGQPGHRHINDQPPSYWRALFFAEGYEEWDVVRPKIIANTAIPYWYRQNILLFAAPELKEVLREKAAPYAGIPPGFALVHESILNLYRGCSDTPSLMRWMKLLPLVLAGFFQRRRAELNRRAQG
jgi:hypothetical protein